MNRFDWSDLDARALQQLVAVVETGSVTGAAQRLGVTQSAVSHLLDKLRDITADPLFVKSGRGIVATARAELLAAQARELIDQLERFARAGEFAPARWQTTFTIAANVTGQANPTEQDVALIYGAGPMGLVTVQALKGVYKVNQVIVVDRIDERLAMAQRSGADWVFNNGEQSLQAALDEKGIKPTLIIDAACHPSILQEAITLASPAARIVLMGFSSEPSQIVQQGITGKELAIFSSRLNANKFPVVIDWLEKGLIDPEKLITHTFDYHHVKDAIELFEKDQRQCCKVLLTFGQ